MGAAGNNVNTVVGGAGGSGGAGLQYSITGSSIFYAGGGGGGSINNTFGSFGGAGGGGYWITATNTAVAGTNGLGGGGGGATTSGSSTGAAGGFGCVIIAYPLSQFGVVITTLGTITTDNSNNISIQPVNNISLAGNTQILGSLSVLTISTTIVTTTIISSLALNISSLNGAPPWQQSFTTSTVIGLGTAGYLSTTRGFVSTANLANLVSTANLATLVSTTYLATQLGSTVIGLGSAGYVSTIISSFYTLSTGSFITSSIVGNNASLHSLSTGFVTLSSLNFIDQVTQVTANVYQKNSLLYFNTLVFAGARTGPGQFLYPQ
jgi:hypothetical protein